MVTKKERYNNMLMVLKGINPFNNKNQVQIVRLT